MNPTSDSSPNPLIASDRVEGTAVRRPNGETIGTIARLMIEKKTGRVAYAVMEMASLFGIEQRHITLPWGVLDYNVDLDAYELDLTDEQLKEAPERGPEGHEAAMARDWEERVHRHYNTEPYWEEG
jgi:hypothetical protein